MEPKANFRPREGSQYIEEMALELSKMARTEGSKALAAILDMAALEAKNSREAMRGKDG